jgi:hypothetical protein
VGSIIGDEGDEDVDTEEDEARITAATSKQQGLLPSDDHKCLMNE